MKMTPALAALTAAGLVLGAGPAMTQDAGQARAVFDQAGDFVLEELE